MGSCELGSHLGPIRQIGPKLEPLNVVTQGIKSGIDDGFLSDHLQRPLLVEFGTSIVAMRRPECLGDE